MFRRGIRSQREKFGRELDAVKAHTAAGQWRDAVLASMRAERIATRLQRAEPTDLGNVWVLGSTCYDQALLWDRLGKGRQAVSAARRALWAYHWLDPSKGDPGRVREVLAGNGPEVRDDAPSAPADLMAHAADARARLARLLAKYQRERRPGDASNIDRYRGRSVAGEVDLLGHDAVGVYEVLVEASHYGQEDLDRVKKQYEAALQHLY
ncbi:hypothetical protein C1I99_03055 [Micromonospora deserti]|uniref:Uncharacterized protein n=1 Tax=Micromonospora deserti TaxID=2070366 RepID=A0A2W2CUU7_9ACTN|nr:hypothetical protein C1I99_03055 [Micromonospora deserti]